MTHKTVLLRLLAAATLLILLLNLPMVRMEYAGLALFLGLLATVTLYFGVLLSQGEISLAYLVGILGILLLPKDSQATLAWGMFVGSLLGSSLRPFSFQPLPHYHRGAAGLPNLITITSGVTLSFVIAGQVYMALGGQQPLTGIRATDIIPLVGLYVTDVTLFFGIFVVAIYIDSLSIGQTLQNNRLLLVTALAVPVPMIILSAALVTADPILVLLLVLAVLTGVNGILYAASRIRYHRLRQQRELEALANISRTMRANQGINTLLTIVYEELARLLWIDHYTVVLLENGPMLKVPVMVRQGQVHYDADPIKRRPNTLLDRVLETQTALLISHDAIQHTRRLGLLPPDDYVSAWLGVPLLAAGRTLGALSIASTDTAQRFGREALYILNIISTATSAHIDNAQLYKQQTERAFQLTTLNTVLALLTETLSPDEVLDIVISSASAISEATAVAVYRYSEGSLNLVSTGGLSEDFAIAPLLASRDSVEPLLVDQPVTVENIASDVRVSHLRVDAVREHIAAWIELPLAVSGKDIGAAVLYFDSPQQFSSEHIQHLRTFANQAAQAIQNADLYAGTYKALEVRIEQLSTLARLGRELLTTMDRETIADLLLQYTLDATHCGIGAVLLLQEERADFQVMAQQGYPQKAFSRLDLITQGITGRVLRDGHTVCCNTTDRDADYLPLVMDTRSQLSVPLIWQGRVLGAITLESPEPYYFSEEHSGFVTQLVNQVTFAIENAHLFHDAAEGRDRMAAILNTMTEALILVDRHERIALANPRVLMLGLDSQQLIAADLHELLADPELDLASRLGFQSDKDLFLALRETRAPTNAYAYTLTSGKAPLHLHREIIPVEDEQGEVIGRLLAFYDETTRYNLDRARDEFSQMIIHDLRSPLTAVTSSVMLLTEMIPPENEFSTIVAKTAGSSQRAIRKLLNRVDSLLDVSRMKSGQMTLQLEIAQLSGLISNVQAELEPLAQDLDISIMAQLPAEEPYLVIDTEKVERVLLNLVDNALKFSPRESDIIIHTTATTDGASKPLLRVEVVDHGPGVAEDERQSIFDRYVQIQQQGHERRRGSGLGLNFCKLAVEAHGGSIWIESNPEGGSIFAFTLPMFIGELPLEAD